MKSLIQAIVVLSLVAMLAGVVMLGPYPQLGGVFIAAGVATLTWMYFLDKRYDERAAAMRAAEVASRVSRVTNEARQLGRAFAVRLSPGILFLQAACVVLAAAAGGGLIRISLDPFSPKYLTGGLVCLVLAALILLRMIPNLGRDLIRLSREGVHTSRCGFVPWQAVHGIEFQRIEVRGHVTHFLRFLVPSLETYARQMHPVERIFRRLRTQKGRKLIVVPLKGASEYPETVEGVARALWKLNTGRNYPWFSDMSEEATAALVRQAENAQVVDRLLKSETVDHDEAMRRMEAMAKDMEIVRADMKRGMKSSSRILLISLAVMAVFVLLGVLGRK